MILTIYKVKNVFTEPSWSEILTFLYFQQKTVSTKIMYLNNVNRNSDSLFSHRFLHLYFQHHFQFRSHLQTKAPIKFLQLNLERQG